MQLGGPPGPPDNCCARLITLSFTDLTSSILNWYMNGAEYSRDNGDPGNPKPGDGEPLSDEDKQRMVENFIENPDEWVEKPGNPNKKTFQRLATFCNGTGEIEYFGK